MKVTAEIFTGRLFYVEVGEDATVGDLKNEIGNQEDLPTDRLILMLADGQQILDKDKTPVKDYGLQDSSLVYIFFRFIDSGYSASPSKPEQSISIGEKPEHKANGNSNGPSSSVDSSSTQ